MAMSFELPTEVEALLLEQAAREGITPAEVASLAVVDRAMAWADGEIGSRI